MSVSRCPILSAGLCAHPAVTNCVPGGHVAMLRMCCGSAWAAGWRAQDASPPRRLPYHFHHHHHHHHLPFSSPPSIGTRLPLLPSTNIASHLSLGKYFDRGSPAGLVFTEFDHSHTRRVALIFRYVTVLACRNPCRCACSSGVCVSACIYVLDDDPLGVGVDGVHAWMFASCTVYACAWLVHVKGGLLFPLGT